jgi:competence protein ComEA
VKRKTMLGLPLWLVVLLLFAIAGVAAWQGGLLDFVLQKVRHQSAATGPVNINTASEQELRALPNVDEKMAADIVKKRPFETVDDIKKVKGIGDKKLEKLRPLITVD